MSENQTQDMSVKVAIVEDDSGTRQGWVNLLRGNTKVECVAAFESAELALQRIPECRPQVVLMDINLPGMTGLRCTALLKQLLPKTQKPF